MSKNKQHFYFVTKKAKYRVSREGIKFILRSLYRALLICVNNCQTRCNKKQSIFYSASSLYMFQVSTTPIIRSTQNCNCSIRYWTFFLGSYLPPTCDSGFPESSETPGNRRFPGVTQNSGFPESYRVPWVTRTPRTGRSLWVTPETESFCWTREHGVHYEWLQEHGVLGDSGNPEFRVISGTHCSWFHVTPGTRSCGWLREPEFPGESGNPEFRRLRKPGIPSDSGNPEFCVTSETQSSWRLRWTTCYRSSAWLLGRSIPGTSGTRSSGWLR